MQKLHTLMRSLSTHCTRGGYEQVNMQYVRTFMVRRATALCYAPREDTAGSCGFALAYDTVAKPLSGEHVLFIDLVCTRDHQGTALLRALENYAQSVLRVRVVALRAVSDELVKVYQKKGYSLAANACEAPTKAARLLIERLNAVAEWQPKGKYVYVDDEGRVASSVAEAWALAGGTPRARALPDGWKRDAGGHGYWMSKCVSFNATGPYLD